MRILFSILLCFLFFHSSAQTLSEGEIVGTWTVVDVKVTIEAINPEQSVLVEGLKQGFTNSKFQFSEDGNFKLIFPPQKPEFFDELFFLENSKWILSDDLSMIKIGTDKDRFSLMEIQYRVEGEDTYFLLRESGIKLSVKK